MASGKVVVLYEDRRGATPEFGLHKLVVRLVADQSGGELWALHTRIKGHPTNGSANLLEKARAVDVVAPNGEAVVAVLDDDKVRQLLQLAPRACKREVIAEILVGCSDRTRLSPVLLEDNVESVLDALRLHASALSIAPERFENAVNRKSLNDRDAILIAAARLERQAIRDALLSAVPSLRKLRDRVREAAGLR